MNGRLHDVLIEVKPGLSKNVLTIWADKGMAQTIESVEGVANIYCPITATEYDVYVDKRYDIEIVKANIFDALTKGDDTNGQGR